MNYRRMYTLKRNKDYLGLSDNTLYSRHVYYNISFTNISHARKVQYTYDQNKQICMFRHKILDIANDTNRSINKSDLNALTDEVDIIIPKRKLNETCELSLYQINIDRFLMTPIVKNVGIIIPFKLDYETNDDIIFKCLLVEPVQSRENAYPVQLNSHFICQR